MKVRLEPDNNDVISTVEIRHTDIDIRLVLSDCDKHITWRFKNKSKPQVLNSILKTERLLVEIRRLQDELKSSLFENQ